MLMDDDLPYQNGVSEKSPPAFHKSSSRDNMQTFWRRHSIDASVEEMMLDSNAEELGKEEIPEILSSVPDMSELDILELGAGIGRFTSIIADQAKSVVAVDFMESFVAKNQELNGHRPNCQFLQADVTKLDLPAESFDLIFSNWLLMYLDDDEVQILFENILTWLRPGGSFFFRESCYHPSGNTARTENPTQYRDPGSYNQLLESVSLPSRDGQDVHAFEVVMSRNVQTYIKHKSNRNQICWLVEKTKRSKNGNGQGYKTFQEFLDKQQYTMRNIRCYEWIFGRNFCCPGGLETTEEVIKMLSLRPGQHVLDIGCSVGGSAFLMAQKYNVNVVGIDMSTNMVTSAWQREKEFHENRVRFEVGDVTRREFPSESFDVIYSRDTFLHIKDKHALFNSLFSWLKPGGKLLLTDYCSREDNSLTSDSFAGYVQSRGYHLLPVRQYGQELEEAGFNVIVSEDRSEEFINMLTRELQQLQNNRDDFVEELSTEDYDRTMKSWEEKLDHCIEGDHHWGLFYAVK